MGMGKRSTWGTITILSSPALFTRRANSPVCSFDGRITAGVRCGRLRSRTLRACERTIAPGGSVARRQLGRERRTHLLAVHVAHEEIDEGTGRRGHDPGRVDDPALAVEIGPVLLQREHRPFGQTLAHD